MEVACDNFFIFHPSCNITFDMSPPSTPVSLPGSRQIHTLRYKYSHVYYYIYVEIRKKSNKIKDSSKSCLIKEIQPYIDSQANMKSHITPPPHVI